MSVRRAAVVLGLVVLAGCGGSPGAGPSTRATSPTSATASPSIVTPTTAPTTTAPTTTAPTTSVPTTTATTAPPSPSEAHPDVRAKQRDRVFNQGLAPLEDGLEESQRHIGAMDVHHPERVG